MRPLATSCPPDLRNATATGAAQRFSQTSTAAHVPGFQRLRRLLEILLADQAGRRPFERLEAAGIFELAEVDGGDGPVLALDHQRDVEHAG